MTLVRNCLGMLALVFALVMGSSEKASADYGDTCESWFNYCNTSSFCTNPYPGPGGCLYIYDWLPYCSNGQPRLNFSCYGDANDSLSLFAQGTCDATDQVGSSFCGCPPDPEPCNA